VTGVLAEVAVETTLLALKIAFLVLLYLFIWRIVRTASRDVRLPQESFILSPDAALGRAASSVQTGRLVVVGSPALDEGMEVMLNSAPLTVGRGGQNDIELEGDDFASARHARIEPRRDGVWIGDMGSTNGTYVNGSQLERPRRLAPGDIVRIGQTDFRFER
jgi:pSer/pThr/pTyr-binding forkhead associated (FHA) protein